MIAVHQEESTTDITSKDKPEITSLERPRCAQEPEWYADLLTIPDIKQVIEKEGGEDIYNGGPEYRPVPAERPFGLLKWLAAASSRSLGKLFMSGARELRESRDLDENCEPDGVADNLKTFASWVMDSGAIGLALIGRAAMVPIDAARYYLTLPNSIEAIGYQLNQAFKSLFGDSDSKEKEQELKPVPATV